MAGVIALIPVVVDEPTQTDLSAVTVGSDIHIHHVVVEEPT